jgi:hypothetical protein
MPRRGTSSDGHLRGACARTGEARRLSLRIWRSGARVPRPRVDLRRGHRSLEVHPERHNADHEPADPDGQGPGRRVRTRNCIGLTGCSGGRAASSRPGGRRWHRPRHRCRHRPSVLFGVRWDVTAPYCESAGNGAFRILIQVWALSSWFFCSAGFAGVKVRSHVSGGFHSLCRLDVLHVVGQPRSHLRRPLSGRGHLCRCMEHGARPPC